MGFYPPLESLLDHTQGPPLEAIIDPSQVEQITALVDEGVRDGATLWQAPIEKPGDNYYLPSLLTDVSPSSVVVREEIFGPVLCAMSFRTPTEAIALANNSAYGLAASVWSESINLALDIAPALKVGVVWINSTNRFDASAGFGGYRESGFGREGGYEGMFEYLKPGYGSTLKSWVPVKPNTAMDGVAANRLDRTAKMYIGGVQARPDGGASRAVYGADGTLMGHVGEGNRKDIRNAVEAAFKATAWSTADAHNRAQILYCKSRRWRAFRQPSSSARRSI